MLIKYMIGIDSQYLLNRVFEMNDFKGGQYSGKN